MKHYDRKKSLHVNVHIASVNKNLHFIILKSANTAAISLSALISARRVP